MPTQFGTKDDAKNPGPWPHKILEIGMVASKKKVGLALLTLFWAANTIDESQSG
jgi:hypothetical protein